MKMKIMWTAILLAWVVMMGLALAGCGYPKPVPYVPEGEASCLEACFHIENDLPMCRTTQEKCTGICQDIAGNNPRFPTCLARAQSCQEAIDCGSE